MSNPTGRGLSRQGVDAAFVADEAQKSHLLLEAQLLRAQQQAEAAADKLVEAAMIEERLRERCFTMGLREKAFVHGFSAASCWAQAGDFHHAIGVCQDLLAHADLPHVSDTGLMPMRRLSVPVVPSGMRSWSSTKANRQVSSQGRRSPHTVYAQLVRLCSA